MTDQLLRLATIDDENFLWAMLYEAAHAGEQGMTSPDALRAIPELACYVQGWGAKGDLGVIGDGQGAAWVRLLTTERRGYGYVDDATPELAIATTPQARGTGLGTALLTRLIGEAESLHPGISLSVRAENPARRLYRRLGFVEISGSEIINRAGSTSLTMVLRFD